MEDDEDTLCKYGTPLDPIREDEIPSKKPIQVEDQIVVDSNGRRRFHGAFTGGFSAGYWNSVGSQEGWKPTAFKSSRAEKADKTKQRPEDFMDDEDQGEFGFAPQRIQTTEDFTAKKSKKRKFEQPNSGQIIPGVPLLHSLLEPARDNIAIRLLKKMGWKEGQGIGARMTREEKKSARARNKKELYVMKKYGCDLGPNNSSNDVEEIHQSDSDESDISDTEITFAPDDFEPFVLGLKDNLFGLGYSGLNRDPILKQHINLFDKFQIFDNNNKKFSISGQAFGVGALEEEDDDIYARDDMTKYDFSLEKKNKAKLKDSERIKDAKIIEGFIGSKSAETMKKGCKIFRIEIPLDYKPRNWAIRRTRFDKIDADLAKEIHEKEKYRTKGLGRHDLNPIERGKLLEGSSASSKDNKDETKKDTNDKQKEKGKDKPKNSIWELINSKSFTKGEVLNDDKIIKPEILNQDVEQENQKIQLEASKITKDLNTESSIFRPFVTNAGKQERYEKFLELKERDNESIVNFLTTIQPLNMTDWEREMEKKEFIQAAKLYKPLRGLMSDRFETETEAECKEKDKSKIKIEKLPVTMKRTKGMWRPHSNLCKRFNIPDPYGGLAVEKPKKRARFSVFDYLENSLNTKSNFVTPVIMPVKSEKVVMAVETVPVTKEIKEVPENIRLTSKKIFDEEIDVIPLPPSPLPPPASQPSTSGSSSRKPSIKSTPKVEKKSELELKIQEARHKHPSEKKDLFKAIFESSDSEGEKDEEEDDMEAKKQNLVETLLLNKSAGEINILRNTSPPRGIFANFFPKPVEEQIPEVLEPEAIETKTSKDKPKAAVSSIIFKSKAEISKSASEDDESAFYGPKPPSEPLKKPEENLEIKKIASGIKFRSKSERLEMEVESLFGPKPPSKTLKTSVTSFDKDLDKKLEKLLKKTVETKVIEKWVEKEKISKKKKKDKDKDKTKHKKEKKKHKKDKRK